MSYAQDREARFERMERKIETLKLIIDNTLLAMEAAQRALAEVERLVEEVKDK